MVSSDECDEGKTHIIDSSSSAEQRHLANSSNRESSNPKGATTLGPWAQSNRDSPLIVPEVTSLFWLDETRPGHCNPRSLVELVVVGPIFVSVTASGAECRWRPGLVQSQVGSWTLVIIVA